MTLLPRFSVDDYGVTIYLPTWVAGTRRRFHRLRDRLLPACPETHPEYGWPCGGWEYAQQHRLYRKGHRGSHTACGRRPGGPNISTTWTTPKATARKKETDV